MKCTHKCNRVGRWLLVIDFTNREKFLKKVLKKFATMKIHSIFVV